jgi:viroplasmin and RNaseH domain-containing protein
MPALWIGLDRNFGEKVVITSVADNGEVWITKGTTREKIYESQRKKVLAKATPENESLIKYVNDLKTSIKKVENKIAETITSIERVDFGD